MASDWTPPKEINGINLTNYLPQRRSYNSIVFVHKKYLEKCKVDKEKKEKVKIIKDNKNKLDTGQQFNYDQYPENTKDKTFKFGYNNDNSILEHTIKFAKNIVPLTIPPSEDKSNVFYTIKTAKKHKKKDKYMRGLSSEHYDEQHERENVIKEPKKVEKYTNLKRKENLSVKESISHSSNNTLDDLNINQSLCCVYSEVSEKKYQKENKIHSKRSRQGRKISISESFEAVATDNVVGDACIKIHLMNDKDKHFLSDTIKEPILNAIKDCISEVNNKDTEITTVQKLVKCNSHKLDNILSKLTCIENKLDIHGKKLDIWEMRKDAYEKTIDNHENGMNTYESKFDAHDKKSDLQIEAKPAPQLKVQYCKPKAKASSLEELGDDLIEIKEEYSSEEELDQEINRRSRSTAVLELKNELKNEKRQVCLGGGEVPRLTTGSISASIGGKLERPNRIPTRFCWTDAAKNN